MKWLTPDERSRLEAWLDSGYCPSGKHGAKHRLFVAIALESGLRESEILGLKHSQANVVSRRWEGVRRLKRRDGARIDAFMGPRTKDIYLTIWPELPPESELVFRNGPTANSCYKFCLRLGERLEIQHLTPHRLRHTMARDLARAGASATLIQQALGLKDRTTALIYYESTNEEALSKIEEIRRQK